METIWNYLDNMFVNLPQTSEVLRAKEDLAEMMEDKYNELIKEGKMQNEAIGIVISEFGNIQELIDELGIASFTNADFVKKEQEEQDHRKNRAASNLRHVSGLEADEYLFAMKQGSMNIATGVFLCICSRHPWRTVLPIRIPLRFRIRACRAAENRQGGRSRRFD